MSAVTRPAGFRTPAKVLRRLRYLPAAIRTIRNWPSFIWNYALGFPYQGIYRFRNGAQLKIGRAIDHAPIIEIFFDTEYGGIKDGSVIVDLGANIGTFTVYAITMARDVTVYSYEPLRGYYELMLENARLNDHRGKVEGFNVAVAADDRPRELYTEGQALYFPTLVKPPAATGSVSVPCTTLAGILDAHDLRRVDMLKIDCEGAEYEILYNMPVAYFDRIQRIRLEYHNRSQPGANVDDLKSFLTSQGYEITNLKVNSSTNGCLWAERAAQTS